MRDALKPDAARMIRESLEMTRGVRVVEIISVHAASSHLTDMGMAQIKLIGWTPTLHAYEYTWQEDFGIPLSAEHQCEEILRAIQGCNSCNVASEHEAGRLGIVEPIDHRSPEGIDHMLVERSVVALLERDGGNAREALRDIVAQMVEMPGFEGRGNVLHCDDGYASGLRLMPSVPIGSGVYDGGWLHTDSHLPETVLDATVGRRLGDVVDVPPEIADRMIMIATSQRGGARFDVAMDLMEIRDIRR